MIEPPRILTTEAVETAVIRMKIPRSEIQAVMGPAIGEVMRAVAAQGIGPAGPLFSYHFRMTPETFDFEVGVPVTRPVTPAGRVVPSKLPAVTVARGVYQGPYEGLGEAWGAFKKEVAAGGHAEREDLWECYLAGPESGPDPAMFRTELNQPLVSG